MAKKNHFTFAQPSAIECINYDVRNDLGFNAFEPLEDKDLVSVQKMDILNRK